MRSKSHANDKSCMDHSESILESSYIAASDPNQFVKLKEDIALLNNDFNALGFEAL